MEAFAKLLPTMSIDQLKSLQGIIGQRIADHAALETGRKIREAVATGGVWACFGERNEIAGLKQMSFSIPCRVYSRDCSFESTDVDDVEVAEDKMADDGQEKTLERIGLSSDPKPEHVLDEKFRWDRDSFEDPMCALSRVRVSVFYMETPCPKEGATFEALDDEGRVCSWEIKGGKLLMEGDEVDDVSAWADYSIAVLPPRKS
jgi:hypothetical protein